MPEFMNEVLRIAKKEHRFSLRRHTFHPPIHIQILLTAGIFNWNGI